MSRRGILAVPGAPMLEADRCSRWYNDVVAVSDVSFTLGAGVTALLGPNGAGKSTILRMLCGLTAPSTGQVRLCGHDPRADTRAMRFVGLVPQQDGLLPRLTALQFVKLAGVLHGVEKPKDAAIASLELVEIDPSDSRPVDTFSRGMRQRVKIAQALVNGPSIVVADEPLNGLDPRQRRRLIEIFARLGDEGRCVVVSSHVLDEVQRFGSHVLVMAQGRLAAEGDYHAIRELMDDRPHRIRLKCDFPRDLATALLAEGVVVGVEVHGPDRVDIQTVDLTRFAQSIAPVSKQVGAIVSEVVALDDDLESVFRYLVSGTGRGRTR